MLATTLGAVFPMFARLQSNNPDKRLGSGLTNAKLSCSSAYVTITIDGLIQNVTSTLKKVSSKSICNK